jgi:hypothetical protein
MWSFASQEGEKRFQKCEASLWRHPTMHPLLSLAGLVRPAVALAGSYGVLDVRLSRLPSIFEAHQLRFRLWRSGAIFPPVSTVLRDGNMAGGDERNKYEPSRSDDGQVGDVLLPLEQGRPPRRMSTDRVCDSSDASTAASNV